MGSRIRHWPCLDYVRANIAVWGRGRMVLRCCRLCFCVCLGGRWLPWWRLGGLGPAVIVQLNVELIVLHSKSLFTTAQCRQDTLKAVCLNFRDLEGG